MGQLKRTLSVLLKNLIGTIIFLFLYLIANLLTEVITNPTYHDIIKFLNSNIFLIFGIIILSVLSELFWVLNFPFNLPAPFFSATFGVLVVELVLQITRFIENLTNTELAFLNKSVINIIYTIVFLAVLILGYIMIMMDIMNPKVIKSKRSHTEEKDEDKKEMDEIKQTIRKDKEDKNKGTEKNKLKKKKKR